MVKTHRLFDIEQPLDNVASTTLTIEPARLRDLWKVRRLQLASFRRGLAYGVGTLTLLYLLPSVRFLVARRGDEILGCAIGDRNNGNSRVINLAVDPDARGRGLGAELLRRLEAQLPQGDMILMVEEGNDTARRLYERSGYVAVGEGRNYYGHGHHGIWMRKFRNTSK